MYFTNRNILVTHIYNGHSVTRIYDDSDYILRLGIQLRVAANRHFSLLNVNAACACGYDFLCDGGRLVRAYVRLRRGAI